MIGFWRYLVYNLFVLERISILLYYIIHFGCWWPGGALECCCLMSTNHQDQRGSIFVGKNNLSGTFLLCANCALVFLFCRFKMKGRWILRSLSVIFLHFDHDWVASTMALTVTKCKLNLIRGLLAAVKFWYQGNFVMVEVVYLCLIVIWWECFFTDGILSN